MLSCSSVGVSVDNCEVGTLRVGPRRPESSVIGGGNGLTRRSTALYTLCMWQNMTEYSSRSSSR